MFGFGKKLVGTMFGQNDKQMSLAPVEEITFASRSTPSLKDTPSTSAESRSLPEIVSSLSQLPIPPPVSLPPPVLPPTDPKKLKKEQERLMKEAEMERRANLERKQRDRSRAVVAKRNQLTQAKNPAFEFQNVNAGRLAVGTRPKTKVSKEEISAFGDGIVPPSVVAANAANAANGYGPNSLKSTGNGTKQRSLQHANSAILAATYDHRNTKWKKGDDDEQSISSSDVQSMRRMSVISFATVDSDLETGRSLRRRQSNYGYGLSPRPVGTATSISSQSYTNSPRSSHSIEPSMRSGGSIDAQFVSDFEARATLAAASGNPLYSPGLHAPQLAHRHSASPTGPTEYADSMSPPNMQFLTLAGSPSHPPWSLESTNGSANGDVGSTDSSSVSTLGSRRAPGPAMISMHNIVHGQGQFPAQHPSPSGYEYFAHSGSHPPTPHSEVNPMFYVVSFRIN
jgi:meiosis induction protein kinase IME2/SME1